MTQPDHRELADLFARVAADLRRAKIALGSHIDALREYPLDGLSKAEQAGITNRYQELASLRILLDGTTDHCMLSSYYFSGQSSECDPEPVTSSTPHERADLLSEIARELRRMNTELGGKLDQLRAVAKDVPAESNDEARWIWHRRGELIALRTLLSGVADRCAVNAVSIQHRDADGIDRPVGEEHDE